MVERRKNRFSRGVRDVRDRIMGTASATGQGVSQNLREMKEHSGERLHDMEEQVEHLPEAIRQRSAGSPLVAGGVAFGLGVLIAAAFPPTERERQMAEAVGDRVEPLKQEAAAAAREVAEHLSDSAQEAMSEVKQAASEGAEHVREQVQSEHSEHPRSTGLPR
jgi:gas vesicle protein